MSAMVPINSTWLITGNKQPRLGEAQPFPLLSQLITPLLRHDRTTTTSGFLLTDPATVGIPVLLREAAHWPSSSARSFK